MAQSRIEIKTVPKLCESDTTKKLDISDNGRKQKLMAKSKTK